MTLCKLKWVSGAVLGLALLPALPSSSRADTLTFNFSKLANGNATPKNSALDPDAQAFLYTSHSNAGFSNSNATITAYGFSSITSNISTDLFYKVTSNSSETGLGLASDPNGDHEVYVKSSLQLDFSNLARTLHLLGDGITGISFTVGSSQTGENFDTGYKSEATIDYKLGTLNTANFSGKASGIVSFNAPSGIFTIAGATNTLSPTVDNVFTLTAVGDSGKANVLLDSVVVTYSKPNGFDTVPAPSSLVMLLGFGAVGVFGHFYRRRRSARATG